MLLWSGMAKVFNGLWCRGVLLAAPQYLLSWLWGLSLQTAVKCWKNQLSCIFQKMSKLHVTTWVMLYSYFLYLLMDVFFIFQIIILLKASCFSMFLLCNALMWISYSKSLQRLSSLSATVINSSSNLFSTVGSHSSSRPAFPTEEIYLLHLLCTFSWCKVNKFVFNYESKIQGTFWLVPIGWKIEWNMAYRSSYDYHWPCCYECICI